jgi:hypothetical protein
MRTVAARLLLLMPGGLFSLPVCPQLYKWTDEQGRIHYSDKAPAKGTAKQVEKPC